MDSWVGFSAETNILLKVKYLYTIVTAPTLCKAMERSAKWLCKFVDVVNVLVIDHYAMGILVEQNENVIAMCTCWWPRKLLVLNTLQDYVLSTFCDHWWFDCRTDQLQDDIHIWLVHHIARRQRWTRWSLKPITCQVSCDAANVRPCVVSVIGRIA